MARRIARSPFIPIKPPAQLAYLLIEEPEALFTGAGGNGKTTALMLAMLVDVDRPGYRALMVQRTMAGPVTLAERIREWLEPAAGAGASWDSSARCWRFPTGAILGFSHERHSYVAGEYHAIAIDDATGFSDAEYRRLFQVWLELWRQQRPEARAGPSNSTPPALAALAALFQDVVLSRSAGLRLREIMFGERPRVQNPYGPRPAGCCASHPSRSPYAPIC